MLFSFCNIHKEKTNITWKTFWGKVLHALHDNVRKTRCQGFTISFPNFKIQFDLEDALKVLWLHSVFKTVTGHHHSHQKRWSAAHQQPLWLWKYCKYLSFTVLTNLPDFSLVGLLLISLRRMKNCLDVCSHHHVFTSMLLLFQYKFYILQMLKWWLFLSLNKNNRQWLEVRNGLLLPSETHLSQRRSDMASLLSNLHGICCKLNPTMLIKLDFVLHSCGNFTESSVGALRESGGRTHGTVRIFQNGFCTCECFDNYCTLFLSLSLSLLSDDGLCYPHLYSVFTFSHPFFYLCLKQHPRGPNAGSIHWKLQT